MNKVYISLGSNLGDREKNLENGIAHLEEKAGKIVLRSSLYETEPWKMKDTNDFINQAILLETTLTPQELIEALLGIENKLGRVRASSPSTEKQYTSRLIDMDILFYNDLVLKSDNLTIPHPLLHLRRFILEPLFELNPDLVHPVLHKKVSTLLAECPDAYSVAKVMFK